MNQKDTVISEETMQEVPIEVIGTSESDNKIDMNEIVGNYDVLFICLDTLRYDVAIEEEQKGTTKTLNKYGKWIKCHAPGNFTYPSHHAMFAGFLPLPVDEKTILTKNKLFFPKNIGLGRNAPKKSFMFEGATIIEGFQNKGYETICIGGVSFFDKRTPIGSTFPNMFNKSFWNPSFSCLVKESPVNQINKAKKEISNLPSDKRYFLYINFSAIHYPNNYYIDGEKHDNKATHAEALKYLDDKLDDLFAFCKNRNKTFVIACSDHGTCYGEDGYLFHGFNHEIVNTVPYKHFVL